MPSIGYIRTTEYLKGKKVDEQELKNLIANHVCTENKRIERWSLLIIP